MKNAIVIAAAFAGASFASATLYAQDPHGHDQATGSATATQPRTSSTDARALDEHMKQMRSIHERTMAAKTPEERRKVMDDAHKAMTDSMATMGEMMSSGGMAGRRATGSQSERMHMMEKRMDMMQMMMQMMMDEQAMGRAAPGPDASK